MNDSGSLLNSGVSPLSSLGLYAGRVTGSVVGRPSELAAIEQGLSSSQRGMTCIAMEGEPGIGKTRLLLAVGELARGEGFIPIAVTADEEIRGPFLVARSIFGSPEALGAADSSEARQAMQHVVDALSGKDDPGLESLAPDQKLLRVFDLASLALRQLAAEHPVALMIDDLQWADEDSLRLLRYVVRVAATSPILLVLAMRADEIAFVNEAVTLLADIDRVGLLRRLKLGRFSQLESTEFLQQILAGQINLSSAATMHAQAEGVPFVLAEQVNAYREAGLIQQIDGVWTLSRNAERLLPAAVRTLIQRRSARLPDEAKACMAEAAILGRNFSLRDLQELKARLGGGSGDADSLAELLSPAVAAGLLIQHPHGSSADYSFSHEQIREFVTGSLLAPRRKAIHAALVEMLSGAGEPSAGSLPLIARHALAAGQPELCARASIDAAKAALEANAPDEVLRLVDLAHPVATAPGDRVELLCLQDEAFNALRRPSQRLESLAELAALAEAMGDSELELNVMLRRASALRFSQEFDRAAEIGRRVRELASGQENASTELAACLELGQALLRVELGEGYTQTPTEADLDGAAEAFGRASELAEQSNDEPNLAASTRELGIITLSRVRAGFVEMVEAGHHIDLMKRLTSSEALPEILRTLPIGPLFAELDGCFRKALEIYERLGDRRGAMSTIIAMAYASWAAEIHLPGSPKRIEEIHRLMMRMKSMTKESERVLADAQMLFGAHVYSRAKVFPDVAITKGKEAHAAARVLGDRSLEFAIAGSMALAHAEIGGSESKTWLDRAATLASAKPNPLRARRLESWRGMVSAASGDSADMRLHLEQAVQLATNQGRPAARCEALAQLALGAARLGAESQDQELLALAERSAQDAKTVSAVLPGKPLWGAQADAALARVAGARGDNQTAAQYGKAALAALDGAMQEDLNLEILLPAAEAILLAGNDAEVHSIQERLRLTLGIVAMRIVDDDVRVRWFRSPIGLELTKLTGSLQKPDREAPSTPETPRLLADSETALLRLLTEGLTNREIAEAVEESEESVAKQLAEIFTKIGASSRADATAVALMGSLV